MTLNEVGFKNVALHAMIRQKERLAALAQFRSNIIRILIATDVASRGVYQFMLLVFTPFKHL
jgi:ATP-dependent RNA helicase DDX49/DBP8